MKRKYEGKDADVMVREAGKVLLWVAAQSPPASHGLIETTAGEFGRTAVFCTYEEITGAIGAHQPQLVAIEIGDLPEIALGLLRELHERLPQLTLFAASTDDGIALMRSALDAGASDFFSLPLNSQELHKALIKFGQPGARPLPPAHPVVGDVITVYGARGGLGVTTIAVNLAVRLARLAGGNSALVDLDLQRGDVAAFLNLTPAQSIAAIGAAPGEVDELFLHGTLTRHPSGVFVLPAPAQIEDADIVTREHVETALRLLRSRFRYTVVDTARTLTETTLAAFEQTERLLLLTDLSVPGVRAAKRTVDLLRRLEMPLERIELLVAEAIPGPVKLEDAVRALGKDPFMIIGADTAWAGRAMNTGAPLNGVRDSVLANAMSELAAKLAGVPAAPKAGGRRFIGRLFGRGRDRA